MNNTTPAALRRIIYMSKASRSMSPELCTVLLLEARRNNERSGITGMLLYVVGDFLRYYGGRFIQVIEGPVADVSMLLESIRRDTRHEQIIMLCDELITTRDFPAWSMGFELLPEEQYKQLPGWFRLDERFLDVMQLQASNAPLKMLRSFYALHLLNKKS